MMKMLFVGRRAAGRTRTGALRHLAHVHGQMVVRPPADAGPMPRAYTQHHVLDGGYPATGGIHGLERDLVTEFWFDDPGQMRAATQTDYYLNSLSPDEPRFVDRATVEKLRVTPRVLREGARGRYKLLLLLTRRPDAAWDMAVEQTTAALAAQGFGAVEINDAVETPLGAPFVDAVLEAWHDDAAAPLALADRLPDLPLAAAADVTRSIALAVEVFTTGRLLAFPPDRPGG